MAQATYTYVSFPEMRRGQGKKARDIGKHKTSLERLATVPPIFVLLLFVESGGKV